MSRLNYVCLLSLLNWLYYWSSLFTPSASMPFVRWGIILSLTMWLVLANKQMWCRNLKNICVSLSYSELLPLLSKHDQASLLEDESRSCETRKRSEAFHDYYIPIVDSDLSSIEKNQIAFCILFRRNFCLKFYFIKIIIIAFYLICIFLMYNILAI